MDTIVSSYTAALLGTVLVLGIISMVLLNVSSEEESIVNDSYQIDGEEHDFKFLIGESELLKSKSEQESDDAGTVSRMLGMADSLPFISQEWLEQKLEDIYLSVIDRAVSRGNIVVLAEGDITSTQIEDELTIHSIEKAGDESEYDFYAGTYENGYLIGGNTVEDGLEYEILDELDDRIRDLDVADVTGDASNEVLATTHFDGITAIYYPDEDWKREIIDRERYGEESTYSHEVETGDVTGDGRTDIVSTPSEPNTWDEEQSGVIKLFNRVEGEWTDYEADELEKSHIRKVVINPEDNSVIGGVGQRNEPYNNDASLIKYRFDGESLVEEDQVVSPEAIRNFYPFLVERDEGNLVVALSSDSLAHVVRAEDMEDLYTERFTDRFEAFYTAKTFDYTGDGQDELAVVQDGKLVIYEVTEEEMTEIASMEVYSDFDSSMIWSVEAIQK